MSMSYMECATYLGMLNFALATFGDAESEEGEKLINAKMMEALATTQMVMYELAKQELQESLGGEDDV